MSTNSTVSGVDISEMTNTLFEMTDDLVFFLDKECNIIVANSSVLEKTGYNLEELKGKKIYDLFSSNFQVKKGKFCSSIYKTGYLKQEIEFSNKDKSTFYAESVNYLVVDENGETKHIISINRDVTEQKLAEEALQDSETRCRELFDNMSGGVAIYEAINDGEDFIFKDFNKAGEHIEQINKEELIGRKITEAFPMIKEFGLFDVLKRVWETGEPESHPITFYQDKRIAGWRDNYVYKLPSGEIVSVYDDITEQKLAEEELRLKDQAIESSINAIAIGDFKGKLTYINLAFLEMWGFSDKTEVLGRHILEFWQDPTDAEEVIGKLQTQNRWIGELVAKKKDGTLFNVQLLANMVFNEEGVPINM
ncbi:MAG: PAS domain S-box protein, partial [Candidatus Heimdallarchaeota archaeon]|nr:PAS domain S-box protein [Candidatus Heimdallarchaeota archaeon]MCK4253418.1 PAS domain S-box protein [Candidatus Heimdallarchaeota archaeon]